MNTQFKLTTSGAVPDAASVLVGSGSATASLAIVSRVASRADTKREGEMNREMLVRHRRAARMGRMRAEVALACAATGVTGEQGLRLDDASGMALEIGQVEHWGFIEHIEYGNYVNELEIGGGNVFGPGSGHDWTGEQR